MKTKTFDEIDNFIIKYGGMLFDLFITCDKMFSRPIHRTTTGK